MKINQTFVSDPIDSNKEESTNNGNYCCYYQFRSPVPGLYLYREYMSYHGDLEPMPEFEAKSFTEYMKLLLSCERDDTLRAMV